MRRALLAVALVAGACTDSTELMLIVKTGPGLSFGRGGDIDALRVSVQPALNDPMVFTLTRSIELCSPTEVGTPSCRPQRYAASDYDGALTLPVRLLLEPGGIGADEEVRVWVDALAGSRVRMANGLRFRFAPNRRLWLEVPLYRECLGFVACQPADRLCRVARECGEAHPSTEPPPGEGVDPNDLSGVPDPPDAAQACGMLGMQCCPRGCDGNGVCNVNNYCIDPTIDCGQQGQACCAGASCSGTLMCTNTTCQTACGDTDQACCNPDPRQCNMGSDKCINGMCKPCGTSGLVCCPGMPPYCYLGHLCDTSGSCETCGTIGDQCCNGYCSTGSCNGVSCVSGSFPDSGFDSGSDSGLVPSPFPDGG